MKKNVILTESYLIDRFNNALIDVQRLEKLIEFSKDFDTKIFHTCDKLLYDVLNPYGFTFELDASSNKFEINNDQNVIHGISVLIDDVCIKNLKLNGSDVKLGSTRTVIKYDPLTDKATLVRCDILINTFFPDLRKNMDLVSLLRQGSIYINKIEIVHQFLSNVLLKITTQNDTIYTGNLWTYNDLSATKLVKLILDNDSSVSNELKKIIT